MKSIVIAFALLFASCSREPQPTRTSNPTLAIINAKVWTGDPARPWVEAVGVSGDSITLTGTSTEVRGAAQGAEIIDAGGRLIVPGFIDTHVHFLAGGFRLASVQLRDARTREEFVSRIAAFAGAVPAGTWITGGDWDHSLWGGELPARSWIDAATPNHPVWVNRLDGHMALANSVALKAAGVTKTTPAIAGGEIVRGADREPSGVLKDNAMALVNKVVPAPSPAPHPSLRAIPRSFNPVPLARGRQDDIAE